MTDKLTDEPWGYGWYQDGGKKMAMGYLPTIDYPQSERVTEGPFPLYRTPPVDRNSALADERKAILQNKRVNDAIQTALEKGELHLSGAGYLAAPPASVDRNAVLEEADALDALCKTFEQWLKVGPESQPTLPGSNFRPFSTGDLRAFVRGLQSVRSLRTEAPTQVEGGE